MYSVTYDSGTKLYDLKDGTYLAYTGIPTKGEAEKLAEGLSNETFSQDIADLAREYAAPWQAAVDPGVTEHNVAADPPSGVAEEAAEDSEEDDVSDDNTGD